MGGFSLILLLCRSVRLVCLRGTTETAMDMYVTSSVILILCPTKDLFKCM